MSAETSESEEVVELRADIESAGNVVRAKKAAGEDFQEAVATLKELKGKFEAITGTPFDPPKKGKKAAVGGQQQKPKQQQQQKRKNGGSGGSGAGDGSDQITPRSEDYSKWYNDVVYASDLVAQSPVRGCMVIKPWGMALWDTLREDLDRRIKESGAQNAYFPLFIPQSFLSKEAEHVEGFAKECAVVTHHRLCANPEYDAENPGKGGKLIPDPAAKLEEPLVVRPTSETVIWNMFGKWIDSYRELPLKLNQWANVVRWELRTRPFLRSAEFLWQEGHTAHASKEEALATAREMLDVYADACKDVLAVPVVKGVKSAGERFAGADETFTIEALMQNGWALQSGTSHFLGQNFARAFDVDFQTSDGTRELVWATSWGVSTRLIGALVMTHSDDAGLVCPPPVAPVQVVIVPILGKTDEENAAVNAAVDAAAAALKADGLRVKVDDRSNMRPGAKYFEWERKGVPLRLEVGPRDVASGSAMMKARLSGSAKEHCPLSDTEALSKTVAAELSRIHEALYNTAAARLEERTVKCGSYEEMKAKLAASDTGDDDEDVEEGGGTAGGMSSELGFFLVPWAANDANEDAIKDETKATIRCYPLAEQTPENLDGATCFYSGEPATHMAIFARAF